MPHGVNPAMKKVKTSDREAVLDRTLVDPQRRQLRPSHHTLLPSGQPSQKDIG